MNVLGSLSIERNPFSAEIQTLRYYRVYISPTSIISSYSRLIYIFMHNMKRIHHD